MKAYLCFTLFLSLISLPLRGAVPYPGNDADRGVSGPSGRLNAYTGNLSFGTRDLRVAGAVGAFGLSWERRATSRAGAAEPLFGLGHNWTHNWQWEMVPAGTDDEGRAVLSVRWPKGTIVRFTETAPGEWWPAPSIKERLEAEGNRYTLVLNDASEVRFTRQGNGRKAHYTPVARVDANGNVWQLDWDEARLVKITEPAGRWLQIDYQTLSALHGGRPFEVISQVVASDGRKVSYHYTGPDAAGYPVLGRVDYPDGTTGSYTYESPRPGDRLLLVQADDPGADPLMRNRKICYRTESDAAWGQMEFICSAESGAVMEAVSPAEGAGRDYVLKQLDGGVAILSYAPGGNRKDKVDALGFSSSQTFDAEGRGFLVAATDTLGRVTQFENDTLGHKIRQVHADGSERSWTRDTRGRLLTQTDELGHVRSYIRDGRGRVVEVREQDGGIVRTAYNDFGQMLSRTDRSGAETRVDYDERERRIRVTNALGNSTTTAYDELDHVVATTDARGNTTRFQRDAAGRVVKTTFADGASTSQTYDHWGQMTKSVDAVGATRTTVYDAFGRVASRFDALGHETRTEYASPGDEGTPFNRPLRTISPTGRIAEVEYDAKGQPVARTVAAGTLDAATTRTAYDAAGRSIAKTDPLGRTVLFVYDERDRLIKTMSALQHATTTDYDTAGRKIAQTDAKGNATRWTYNAMGRELTKTDAEGHVTTRDYTTAGRLAALIDAKGNTYRFEWDPLGRKTALVYPDGSRETTAYDAAGNKVTEINRAGTVRSYAYDNRNREIRSDWSDGSQTIAKAYDAAGRMTHEDNGVSRLTFAYDELGRLASETQDLSAVVSGGTYDPELSTVSYTYNEDGRKASLVYPDGHFVAYTYNARGQLENILGDGNEPPITSYNYDVTGNATRMPRENATVTLQDYDEENKLTGISNYDPQGGAMARADYTYDEVGNRSGTLTTQDRDGDGTAEAQLDTYRYDETYQVVGADYAAPVTGIVSPGPAVKVGEPATTVRYRYDAVGNRLAVDENGAVTRYVANNLNQYTQVGEFTPTHDRNGNLASMGAWVYRYDAMNRLVEASKGTMTAKFFYDAKNRCVARNFNDQLQLNTYDSWNLIEERDGLGKQQARYVHGRKIDEIIVMVNRHGTFYPHHDVLGNVSMLTDHSGRLAESYSYSVAGQVTISDASGKTLGNSAVGNRWMFTGREWLSEVGLYDYRNRVYSAELGRFLQTDPIRFDAKDINIYRYVSNRFVIAVDPHGLELRIYSSDAWGISGVNHAFLWSTEEDAGIGRSGSSGNNRGEDGVPEGFEPDTSALDYNVVSDLNSHSEAQVLSSVTANSTLNDSLWVPYFNDCHTDIDDALDDLGIDSPGAPDGRFDLDEYIVGALNSFFGGLFSFIADFFE